MTIKNDKIVTIGGGTGHFTLLSGLKKCFSNITAIVSMADDGGSTGRLRDELGVLPPGDVRQCLVALSNSPEILRDLMNYRFEKGELRGHNFGNLFLSALEKIKGNFSRGLEEAIKILNVKGQVLPVSEEKMHLYIKLKNKKLLVGEKQLDHNKEVRKFGIEKVYLKPAVKINPRAIQSIKKAQLIVIGPGDLYGSILPNLLVKGVAETIKQSKAKVVYICNLTNKKGQTDQFDLDDYADFINRYIFKKINYVIYSYTRPYPELIKKYEKREGKKSIVSFNEEARKNRKYKIIKANVLKNIEIKPKQNDLIASTRSFIRHDSDKLAKVLIEILEMEKKNVIQEII